MTSRSCNSSTKLIVKRKGAVTSLFKRKKVVCILIFVLLNNICDPSVADSIKDPSTNLVIGVVSTVFLLILCCLLPLAAIFADMKFNGFYFTIGSLVVGFLISLLYFFQHLFRSLLLMNDTWFEILLKSLSPTNDIYRMLFDLFMILYGTDLMPDASSNELSSFIWWFWFSIYLGYTLTVSMICATKAITITNALFVVDGSHFLCLVVILILCLMLKKQLQLIQSHRKNSLKLIIGALHYAKTHKYPTNQSAFTFCHDTKLTRIDFGKIEYGGPYNEEDIEAVKAFFRLVPYLLCISLLYFPYIPLLRFNQSSVSLTQCLIGSSYFVEYVIAVILIMVYQLILRKFYLCHQRITMMTKVTIGLTLSVISKALFLITELVLQYELLPSNNTSSNCTSNIDDDYNVSDTASCYSTSLMYAAILPQIIGSIGAVICIITSYEFVFAQCPYNMRGLVLGVMYGMNYIMDNLGWWTVYIIKTTSPNVQPSTNTYIYVMNLTVMIVCLVLFYIIRKWYKPRVRNNVFSHYSAAAKYYTNLLKSRTEELTQSGSLDYY